MIPSQDECRRMLAGLVGPVREAGALIMEIHARGVVSRDKPDGSPVTEADEAAERVLLAALADVAPGITVISEENAEPATRSAPRPASFWLIPLTAPGNFFAPTGMGPLP